MKTMKYWVVILIPMILVSCGGGGGAEAGTGNGEPDVPVVDPSQTLQWDGGNWDEVIWQ
jgi:hypothetical protein